MSDYYIIIYIGILGLAWDCPLTVMLGWTEAVWYERFCPTPLVHGQLISSPRTLKLIDLYTCTNGCTEGRGGVGQNLSYYIASVYPNITVNGQSHASPLTMMLGWTEAVWYERVCPTPLVHGQLISSPRTLKLIDLYTCTNGCTEGRGGVGQNLSSYTASVYPNITVNGQSHTNVDKFSYLGGISSSGDNSVHFLQLMTFTIYPIFVPPGTYHC